MCIRDSNEGCSQLCACVRVCGGSQPTKFSLRTLRLTVRILPPGRELLGASEVVSSLKDVYTAQGCFFYRCKSPRVLHDQCPRTQKNALTLGNL
eukprot:6367995-Amphidinium_carterae.1